MPTTPTLTGQIDCRPFHTQDRRRVERWRRAEIVFPPLIVDLSTSESTNRGRVRTSDT